MLGIYTVWIFISVAYFTLLPSARFGAALKAAPDLILAQLVAPWSGETGGPVAARPREGDALPLAVDHAEMLGLAML